MLHKIGIKMIANVFTNPLWVRCKSNFTEKCPELPRFTLFGLTYVKISFNSYAQI